MPLKSCAISCKRCAFQCFSFVYVEKCSTDRNGARKRYPVYEFAEDSIFLLFCFDGFIPYFIKADKFSFFSFIISYIFFRIKSTGTRGMVTIFRNFVTDFLHTSIAFGMRRPFQTIRAKFQVTFQKVPADAFARIYLCKRTSYNRRLRIAKFSTELSIEFTVMQVFIASKILIERKI